jgi:hypothetical protein
MILLFIYADEEKLHPQCNTFSPPNIATSWLQEILFALYEEIEVYLTGMHNQASKQTFS